MALLWSVVDSSSRYYTCRTRIGFGGYVDHLCVAQLNLRLGVEIEEQIARGVRPYLVGCKL